MGVEGAAWRGSSVLNDRKNTVIVPLCKGKVGRNYCKTYREIFPLSIVGQLYDTTVTDCVKVTEPLGGGEQGD